MTKSQVDRLGERLRDTTEIAEGDLELLQEFRALHAEALVSVQQRIEAALGNVEQAARVKTIQTLHEKLRRQATKLSRVQDVAGVRIVADVDLAQQDAIVDRLAREFDGARVIDRRTQPTHGYRAVHLVVRVESCICEMQVRTSVQHLWAEVVERLADRWGRQIRYGGEPDEPDRDIGVGATRRDLWSAIKAMSDRMHALEELAALATLGIDTGQGPEGFDLDELASMRQTNRQLLAQLRELVERDVEL